MRIKHGELLYHLCAEHRRNELLFVEMIPELFIDYDEDKSGTIEITEVRWCSHHFVIK